MVDGRGAEEPDGRHEVDAARDHVVHVEQLVQVEQQPRQVGHEEHAHDEDEEKGELKILGLERKKNMGLHSTEVTYLLLTQQPGVRTPDFTKKFQRKNYRSC